MLKKCYFIIKCELLLNLQTFNQFVIYDIIIQLKIMLLIPSIGTHQW